jgi:hypothetical protein
MTLSERLMALKTGPYSFTDTADLSLAIAVCAAVEAFQAAEQELQEARREAVGQKEIPIELAIRLTGAGHRREAAKARLLEVNLG